jgi:hypothetical protein
VAIKSMMTQIDDNNNKNRKNINTQWVITMNRTIQKEMNEDNN